MFPDDENELISSIGSDLLSHAEEFGEPVRLPLTTQLFPYLLLASRKMTTREMSAWLEQTKGVKLSAVSIAKGLKRPDLHLRRLAEFIQFPATFLAAVYSWDAEELLFEDDPETGRSLLRSLREMIFEAPEDPSPSVSASMESLETFWEPIPQEVKYMCRQFFDFSGEADTEAEAEA